MIDEIIASADDQIRKNKDVPLEFFFEDESLSVANIQNGKPYSAERSVAGGIGVKAIVGGYAGLSFAMDPADLEKTVKRAISNARHSRLEQETLPGKTSYPDVKGLNDKNIGSLGPDDLIGMCADLCGRIKSIDKRLNVSEGSFESSKTESMIINSEGVSSRCSGTEISAGAEAVFGNSSGMHFNASRSLGKFDIQSIVDKASMLAIEGAAPKTIGTGSMTTLMVPEVMEQIFSYTFLPAINADRVQKGQSSLAGKLGDKILPEDMSITDDPLIDSGLNSGPFDRDGVSCRKTKIVEEGVLGTYLYNHAAACKDGVESTGNGVGGYSSMSRIGPTNLSVSYSGKGCQDPVSEVGDGLIIYDVLGAHTANPITGDFSLAVSKAFRIKDGSIAYPVKNSMIAGNIFDLLGKVCLAGKDVTQTGCLVSPTLGFSDQKIIG